MRCARPRRVFTCATRITSSKLIQSASARAVDEISYLAIDSELLDVIITWDQTGSYEVTELQAQPQGAVDDWMTTLL